MSSTSHNQNPATSSPTAANGPSITDRPSPSKATLLPSDEGLSPSPAFMIPASNSSLLYSPMAWISSGDGMVPASLSAVALTRTITRTAIPVQYGDTEG